MVFLFFIIAELLTKSLWGDYKEENRGRLEHIFSDVVSKKLKRNGGHCSTWEEVEAILEANNLDVHTLERYQLSIRDLFKNRYDLTENQDKKLHDLLGVYDFIDYIISVNRKNQPSHLSLPGRGS